MEFVGTGLGLHFDDAGGGLAGFRVVILKGDFGLGDGVEVGVYNDNAEDRILVVGSVEFEVGAGEVLAIDLDLSAALGIFRGSVVEARQFLRTRREQLEAGEVAIEYRKIFNVLLAKLDGDVGAVGFELRNFAGDFDGLRNRADLQRGVDVHRRVSAYRNAGDVVGF